MRLLKYNDLGELSLTKDLRDIETLQYAILSHTWGEDEDEITLQELEAGPDKSKTGYRKLMLCGEQAKKDELDLFWVDTCCIDKTSSTDLTKNINSMFRYYRNAQKCYVYLSDVHDVHSEEEFNNSRWFKRGWTLQELLAPLSVEFFSSDWSFIGSKATLEQRLHDITGVPTDALGVTDLAQYSKEERLGWIANRQTKEKEDRAYCLLGIFGVSMPIIYGEGEDEAFARLDTEVRRKLKPTLRDMDSRMRSYYLSDGRLDIERLSGQRLKMDTCFINLGMVSRSSDRKGEDDEMKENHFSLAFRLKVETPPQSRQVTLQTLFQPRKLRQGGVGRPKRILIWGQAGIGKTTLCKKIVHEFLYNNLWQGLFDRVFWLPLRRLRLGRNEVRTVADIILEVCLHGAPDDLLLVDTFHDVLRNGSAKCLFILDGLDEVSYAFDNDSPMGANLGKLLKQENLIITSRPHTAAILNQMPPELELETIGFFPEQVEEYLSREVEEGNTSQNVVSAIKLFIKQRPIVRSLIRIPVQLDAICYAWQQECFEEQGTTMTLLYQAISTRIWRKDVVRFGKKIDGENITSQQIQDSANIRPIVEDEVSCIEELAFAGFYNELAEFSPSFINALDGAQNPIVNHNLSKSSFLRSSDNFLKTSYQTKHFLHLTIQEFFAAQYFVRHWMVGKAMNVPKISSTNMRVSTSTTLTPMDLIQSEKYNARYDIFWRFVTGVIQMSPSKELLVRFFTELESQPYDYIGVIHQLLIVHCLNEIDGDCGSFLKKSQELRDNYEAWATFDPNIHSHYAPIKLTLLCEQECPNEVLLNLLGSQHNRLWVMRALMNKPYVSPEVLHM